MRVLVLEEFGEQRFLDMIRYLAETSTDRNKDWFPAILKDHKKKYLEWFIVMDGNEVAGFSTIQKFYEGCFRVLTRCYVFEKYRRRILPKADTFESPGTFMIRKQLQWLKDYETVFISLEKITRHRTIINMAKKMKINTNLDWYVGEDMFLTCPNPNTHSCWQNVCFSGKEPNLQTITRAEWKRRYGMPY